MKRIPYLLLLLAALVFSVGGASASTPTAFFNGFETDNAGWDVFGGQYDATRVASGTNGVISATGSYHAEASGPCGLDACGGSAATDWGSYTDTFPAGGYLTSVDVYLNVGGGYANDTRFDWSSAISDTSGNHRRDFVLNGGYYDDTDLTGSGARFVFSASNNAGRGSSFPKNPGRDPFAITSTGWYTLTHAFRDNGAGVLAVDLSISDAGGNVLHSWTLSDPTDVIGSPVGGNRYGWFASQEFPFLALDNSRLFFPPPTCTPTGFYRDNINLTAAQIGGTVDSELDATGCNIGLYIDADNPGGVASGADIHGANYFGVVVDGTSANVENGNIHNIGEVPFNGSQHGVGVFYRAGADGVVDGNTVNQYQKGGIVADGTNTAVSVTNNTVTGLGQVDFIAQNGIQISRGATALVKANTVSGNWYTPKSFVSCGLLFFQANGVKQQANNLFDNEINLCNVGRGGGNFNPSS